MVSTGMHVGRDSSSFDGERTYASSDGAARSAGVHMTGWVAPSHDRIPTAIHGGTRVPAPGRKKQQNSYGAVVGFAVPK